MLERLRRQRSAAHGPVARLAFNVKPVSGPWGGGNQWLIQLVRHFRQAGYHVRFDLRQPVDCVIVGNVLGEVFGKAEIQEYKRRLPAVRCLHCVHDNDLHRGSTHVDALVEEMDELADYTTFVSAWLRDYHAERWFDTARPHTVILNAADPAVFHPIGATPWQPDRPMRLVTHHWSDNRRKGFDVYAEVDRLIADGELPDTELWVIGRWPEDITWQAAQTFAPTVGHPLADLIRQTHVYLTASLWEPGGMHFIEGAQCGLPLVYHEDGGGIIELGAKFGIGFRDDPRAAIIEMRERYGELRAKALEIAPAGDVMCTRYRVILQQLLAG